MNEIKDVSLGTPSKARAESQQTGVSVKRQSHKPGPDSYKDLCPVCTGAGNLMSFKSHRGGLEYWPCPGCHGAGVSVQYGPAVFTKRTALVSPLVKIDGHSLPSPSGPTPW